MILCDCVCVLVSVVQSTACPGPSSRTRGWRCPETQHQCSEAAGRWPGRHLVAQQHRAPRVQRARVAATSGLQIVPEQRGACSRRLQRGRHCSAAARYLPRGPRRGRAGGRRWRPRPAPGWGTAAWWPAGLRGPARHQPRAEAGVRSGQRIK